MVAEYHIMIDTDDTSITDRFRHSKALFKLVAAVDFEHECKTIAIGYQIKLLAEVLPTSQ